MQISRRRGLAPHETDHELLWLTVSLGSLILAALWFMLGLPWPRCIFHELTRLPCVTCGMTRSAIAFFHGHFLAALRWNPLVFVFLCGVTAFDLYAFAVVATRAPRFRFVLHTPAEKEWARIIVIAALVLNWVYLLSHWRDF
jgi:Protein of unknown function (DUF2752)